MLSSAIASQIAMKTFAIVTNACVPTNHLPTNSATPSRTRPPTMMTAVRISNTRWNPGHGGDAHGQAEQREQKDHFPVHRVTSQRNLSPRRSTTSLTAREQN